MPAAPVGAGAFAGLRSWWIWQQGISGHFSALAAPSGCPHPGGRRAGRSQRWLLAIKLSQEDYCFSPALMPSCSTTVPSACTPCPKQLSVQTQLLSSHHKRRVQAAEGGTTAAGDGQVQGIGCSQGCGPTAQAGVGFVFYIGIDKRYSPESHDANKLYLAVLREAIKRLDQHCANPNGTNVSSLHPERCGAAGRNPPGVG
jgi:hypothetical protein